jgi:hypothetical protein
MNGSLLQVETTTRCHSSDLAGSLQVLARAARGNEVQWNHVDPLKIGVTQNPALGNFPSMFAEPGHACACELL